MLPLRSSLNAGQTRYTYIKDFSQNIKMILRGEYPVFFALRILSNSMEQDVYRKCCSILAVGKLPNVYFFKFKGYNSVHHHTFQINQPTKCNDISSLLLDVYLQLNMFRASSRPSSGAQQLQ